MTQIAVSRNIANACTKIPFMVDRQTLTDALYEASEEVTSARECGDKLFCI